LPARTSPARPTAETGKDRPWALYAITWSMLLLALVLPTVGYTIAGADPRTFEPCEGARISATTALYPFSASSFVLDWLGVLCAAAAVAGPLVALFLRPQHGAGFPWFGLLVIPALVLLMYAAGALSGGYDSAIGHLGHCGG
jgi:peptidoglycan/LPS O-acetylase OafA/YrhL